MSVTDFNVEYSYGDTMSVQDPTTGLWKFRLPYPTSSGSDWLIGDIVCEIWEPNTGPRTITSTSPEMARVGNYLDIIPINYTGTTTGWKITLYRRVDPDQNFNPSSFAGFNMAAYVEQQDRTHRLAQEAFAMARRAIQIHPADLAQSSGYDAPAVYYSQLTGTSTMTVYTQPAWTSTVTYALGDVVNYNGAIYISLTAGNSNNTPSTSPAFWNNVTQKINSWSSTATYTVGDVVLYSGAFYSSLTTGNSGNTPSSQGTYWSKLAQSVPAFDANSTYVANEIVAYGGSLWVALGSIAAGGAVPSSTSTTWRNLNYTIPAWASGVTYNQNEFVSYGGKLYYALVGSNTNQNPSTAGSTYWKAYSSGSSGGAGAYYFDDAESGTAGWTLFDDGSTASTPVDGTGVAVDTNGITIATNTSSPLSGGSDYKFTKDAANRRGKGISSVTVGTWGSVPRGAAGETLQLKFRYKTNDVSGTAYADGDFGVWLYDMTNSTLVPLSVNSIKRSTSPDWFIATFISTNAQQYRIIIMTTTTTTGSFDLYFDEVQIGSQIQYSGSAISEWQDYTPTIGAVTTPPTLGTVVINKAQWRRVGSNMEVRWVYQQTTGGTAGSGIYKFPLPSGFTVDAAKMFNSVSNTNETNIPGTAFITFGVTITTQAGAGTPVMLTNDLSNVRINMLRGNTTNAGEDNWGSAIYPFSNTGLTIQLSFSVPISGWSTNVNLATDFTQYRSHNGTTEDIGPTGSAMLTTTPAGTSDSYTLSFPTPSATDLFITEIQRGGTGPWTPAGTAEIDPLRFDGTNYIGVGVYYDGTNVKLVRGKYRNGTSATWAGITASTRWRVRKISNGNMAEQPGVVRAEYYQTANQTGTTTLQICNFDTKVEDTHSCVTTGASWKFTAPVSGVYRITISTVNVGTSGGSATTQAIGIKLNSTSTAGAWSDNLLTNFTKVLTAERMSATSSFTPKGTEEIRLSAGDYICPMIQQDVTSTILNLKLRITITRVGA